MRENNRKPIEKCRKKLPQFTTMNVIDGQAGLVIYSSLILYSLTIDNILNIIVLLILAGVSIATLTGQNGILTQANNAKIQQTHGTVKEAISLAYNEWKLEQNTADTTKIASTEKLTIKGEKENTLANVPTNFIEYLVSKGYAQNDGKILVEELTGSKQPIGNGTESNDIYKIEEKDNNYIVEYYDKNGEVEEIWKIQTVEEDEEALILNYINVDTGEKIDLPCTEKYIIYSDASEEGEIKTANYDFKVDWGDGTVTENITNENLEEKKEHTYNTSGNFEVKITGVYDALTTMYSKDGESYSNINVYKLNSIKQWGKTGLKTIDVSSNIEYIASPENESFEKLEEISFAQSLHLQEIPADLFKNCPNLKSLSGVFYNCRALQEIPEGLFDNCTNIEDFSRAFMYCDNLEKVPSNLFDNCKNAKKFVGTFYGCNLLKGEAIPLWNRVKDNPDYIGTPDGKGCYYGCENLSNYGEIPDYWKQRVPEIEPAE